MTSPEPELPHTPDPFFGTMLLTPRLSPVDLEYGVIEYEAHPTLPPFPHYQHNASIEQLLVLQFHQRMEKITITPNQVDALTLIRSQILSACT